MTPDEIDRALSTTDWRDAFADRTRLQGSRIPRKEDDNRYPTVFEVGLQRGHLVLPGGLRSGQKLRFLLQWHLIPVSTFTISRGFRSRSRPVAADIETGDAVVLDHGDLAEAIRASMLCLEFSRRWRSTASFSSTADCRQRSS